MAIVPVSLLNIQSLNGFETKKEDKKVTNPISQREQYNDTKTSSDAITSYFRGGQALSFKGFDCSTGKFITKEIEDVPCPCCGGKMILNKNIGIKAKEFSTLKGEELAEKIDNSQEYFRTTERMIVNLAADRARQNPEMDLAEAVQSLEPDLEDLTINYCVNCLNKANSIAQEATGSEENPISALIGKEIEKVREGKIFRVDFTEELSLYEGLIGHENFHKLQDEVLNMPEDYASVIESYSATYGDAQDTARELLKPSRQTIEHIHPKSLGGPNATNNYIAECYQCNNPRGHMPYSEWLKIHPEYPRNAQKHIEFFLEQQINGTIPEKYDTYPIEVRETLSKESNGRMQLKVLNPEKIAELREARKRGEEVNVHEEIEKLYPEENNETTAA